MTERVDGRAKEPLKACEYDEDLALLKAAAIPGPMTKLYLKGRTVFELLTVTPGSALRSCVTLDKDLTFLKCNKETTTLSSEG